MNFLDYLRTQYGKYKEADIPLSTLLRGETEEFLPSLNRNLDKSLASLLTTEGILEVINPASKIGGLLGTTKQIIGKSGIGKAGAKINTLEKSFIKDHNFRKRIEDETGLSWSNLRTDNGFMKKYKQLNNNSKLSREDKVQDGVDWINKNLSEYPE
tara:strand:+ start:113 stop:580 length:468 start_codon:yes stop_codon:yes gene_type:complete